MKVHNNSLSPLNTADESGKSRGFRATSPSAADDVHFSELVRSLRSLVPDSPERQERIEQIARSYADGTYKMDAETAASKIIDDSLQYP
jgi:anti-sigma28 factor (negative regulator of flagellin synthesis)